MKNATEMTTPELIAAYGELPLEYIGFGGDCGKPLANSSHGAAIRAELEKRCERIGLAVDDIGDRRPIGRNPCGATTLDYGGYRMTVTHDGRKIEDSKEFEMLYSYLKGTIQ